MGIEIFEKIKNEFDSEAEIIKNAEDLETARVSFLGRKGKLAQAMKEVGSMSDADKKAYGAAANEAKKYLEDAFSKKTAVLEIETSGIKSEKEWIDVTLPGECPQEGHLHPTSQAIFEIEEIFARLGFTRFPVPDIDWDYYSFESLNMPAGHPARDNWETFFIDAPEGKLGKIVATPHITNAQVRILEETKPPLRKIYIGKAYRRQNDVSHLPIHHQFEIFMVDRGLSIVNLKGIIEFFVRNYFGPDRKVRYRPHHFRFTEPSFEIDISCGICAGEGVVNGAQCRLCKSGWLELAGAGMTHPNVLKAGGVDPNEYSALAFAFGIERTLMMRAGISIPDIRLMYKNDLRFNRQF